MALFETPNRNKVPLGVFLIRKNLITERDIDTALAYQKEHPEKRIGEIFHILNLCSDEELLKALAERLGIKHYILPKNTFALWPLLKSFIKCSLSSIIPKPFITFWIFDLII